MYVVIENTPGYLPEEDEPATFLFRDEALVYLSDRLSTYLDSLYDADVPYKVEQGDGWYFVTETDRPHDLGRNFEVAYIEGGWKGGA